MTGNNKYVLSVYSKASLNMSLSESRLDLILMQCQETLHNRDIMQLSSIGVPVGYLKLSTKKQVLDYILNEVKESVPFLQERMKTQKAFNRLGRAITKQIGL